jgi:ABC-type cobalamin/Fe3+-siderophores transport system ATPase subunit
MDIAIRTIVVEKKNEHTQVRGCNVPGFNLKETGRVGHMQLFGSSVPTVESNKYSVQSRQSSWRLVDLQPRPAPSLSGGARNKIALAQRFLETWSDDQILECFAFPLTRYALDK